MLTSLDDFLGVARAVYDAPPIWLKKAEAVRSFAAGGVLADVASAWGQRVSTLEALVRGDAFVNLFGVSLSEAAVSDRLHRARTMIGQLLVGELAERRFEATVSSVLGPAGLTLHDDRSKRNETDYLVHDAAKRPFLRLNIKFHGTLFRQAANLVDLRPEDCFALATYKIWQGEKRQESERLPYVFAIVSAPDVNREAVGQVIPENVSHFTAVMQASKRVSGKRSIEEAIVQRLLSAELPGLDKFKQSIDLAMWRVLSARRAGMLLRERLFERVFALRERGFAQRYRRAEVDMHFSLSDDMTSLESFLEQLAERGPQGVSVDLERGLI